VTEPEEDIGGLRVEVSGTVVIVTNTDAAPKEKKCLSDHGLPPRRPPGLSGRRFFLAALPREP
jgi:hypothetical protein